MDKKNANFFTKFEITVKGITLKIQYDDSQETQEEYKKGDAILKSTSNVTVLIRGEENGFEINDKIGFIELASILNNYLRRLKLLKGCKPCKYATGSVRDGAEVGLTDNNPLCQNWPTCGLKGKHLDYEQFQNDDRPDWCPLGKDVMAFFDPKQEGGGCPACQDKMSGGSCGSSCGGGSNAIH